MHETKKAVVIIDSKELELTPGTCLVINDEGAPIIMKSFIFIGEPINTEADSIIGVVGINEEKLGSYVFQIQNRAFNIANEREKEKDMAQDLAQALFDLSEQREGTNPRLVPNSPFN